MTIDCQHSFKSNLHTIKRGIARGNCIHCNQKLIDWNAQFMLKAQYQDYKSLKKNLYMEASRVKYWEYVPTDKDRTYLAANNKDKVIEIIKQRINRSIRKRKSEIYRDGTQTPKQGGILFIAQHALGLCCRRCVYEWYNIDPEEELTEEDIERFAYYIFSFLEEKLDVSV